MRHWMLLATAAVFAFSPAQAFAQGSSQSSPGQKMHSPGQQMQQTPQKGSKGAHTMRRRHKNEPRGASSAHDWIGIQHNQAAILKMPGLRSGAQN